MVERDIDFLNEEIDLRWLFASKALLQIFVTPISAFAIDQIGSKLPMIIGLIGMFLSTLIFALGKSYSVLFFARTLQGFGSAFADTAGFAMIADRFTEQGERPAAFGIVLAFIYFGCFIAPPFGSVFYSLFGKPKPFLILAIVFLLDAIIAIMVIQPKSRPIGTSEGSGENLRGTPMWKFYMDPFIAICVGALIMANISLAFLKPTITSWMVTAMPKTPDWLIGMIWFPAFFPLVLGIIVTVKLLKKFPRHSWIISAVGLAMEGISCAVVPFIGSATWLITPLSTICIGFALIYTSLLSMLGYLVDTRHVSVYGSVYAIANISYFLAYDFGPIIAGYIVNSWISYIDGFTALCIIICVLNITYLPAMVLLKKVRMGNNKPTELSMLTQNETNEVAQNQGHGIGQVSQEITLR